MVTNITYDGAVITTVELGQSATIRCYDKYMVTDIEIEAGHAGILKYGDAEFHFYAGDTVIVGCADEVMANDIIVSLPYEMSANIVMRDGSFIMTRDKKIFIIRED